MSDVDLERQLSLCDEVLQEYSDSVDPVAVARVAVALRDKALVLSDLGRHADALALWDEMLERYTDDPPVGNELITLEAGYGRARALDDVGRDRESLDACDALLERWQSDPATATDTEEGDDGAFVDRARYLVATLLTKLRIELRHDHHSAALRIAETIIDRYAVLADLYVELYVVSARGLRVATLRALDRNAEAVSASRALSDHFDQTDDRDVLLHAGDYIIHTARGLVWPTRAGWRDRAIAIVTLLASAAHVDDGRRLWPPTLRRRVLAQRSLLDESLRLLDLLDERLTAAQDPELTLLLARARDELMVVHALSGRFALSNHAAERMFELGEPAVRMLRARADAALAQGGRPAGYQAIGALLGLGVAYDSLGRDALATDALTECIDRFNHIRAPAIQASLALARWVRRSTNNHSEPPKVP